MSDARALTEFTNGLGAQDRATVNRLAEVIGSTPQRLDSALRWRRLTYALDGDFHHWLCGIAVTKRSVDLIFHFGGILEDPDHRFVVGTSKFLRKLSFTSPHDVDPELVRDFLDRAIGRLPYFRENWKAIQAGTLPK